MKDSDTFDASPANLASKPCKCYHFHGLVEMGPSTDMATYKVSAEEPADAPLLSDVWDGTHWEVDRSHKLHEFAKAAGRARSLSQPVIAFKRKS